MTGLAKVVFELADTAAEERLIREYVAPAFERLDRRDDVQWPLFNRYGQDPAVDGGQVVFAAFGDAESLVEDERSRWTELAADGPVLDWRVEVADARLADLDDPERFRYRMRSAASRMSLEFFERFEEIPDSLDEFDDEERPVGWGVCLHHLVNQLGYQADGGQEEIELLFRGLVARLYAMAVAPGYGVDVAEGKIEDLVDELESLPPLLRRMEDEQGA